MSQVNSNAKNHRISIRWSRVDALLRIGLAFLVISGLLVTFRERIVLVCSHSGLIDFPILHLSVLLLVCVLFLIVQWFRACYGEIVMLRSYLEDYVPQIPSGGYYTVVLTALFLGTMGYFSPRILIFSAIFVCYNLSDIWGQWYMITRFRIMIKSMKTSIPSDDTRWRDWRIIETYYLGRPHIRRCIIILVCSIICVVLSTLALFPDFAGSSRMLTIIAYVIMILNIAVSEAIIMNWRRIRDRDLEETYA